MVSEIRPGQRFADAELWADLDSDGLHIWRTLGFRRTVWEPGRTVVEWQATADYAFPANQGPIIQGGMVATVLDAAMGGAAWTVLDRHESFLTADLRMEYYRATAPGLLRAEGLVVRRTKKLVFCSGELRDADGRVLSSSRCTQIVLEADGGSGRYNANGADGSDRED